MTKFSDYIVFVDESGDHGLLSVDPDYPVFVLAFCIFKKDTYADFVSPQMIKLKFKYFGHDQVILHERDIRKSTGPFRMLQNPKIREQFLADISTLVEDTPFTLIASAIDKTKLKNQYTTPENPYHLALAFGLERVFLYLSDLNCSEDTLHLVFEQRGAKEDQELELEFRRNCDSNFLQRRLPFEIIFSNKQSNSTGLQLADLLARPIGRKILNPGQRNKAYEILEPKFRKSAAGAVKGWGLKVFP